MKKIMCALVSLFMLAGGFSVSAQSNSSLNKDIFVGNRSAGKYVALTFDDGPHKEYTPEILDILKKYDAKATFFVIGSNAENCPEIIKREFDEGHEIGNHTYSHPKMREISLSQLTEEIEKTQRIVKDITGKAPVLFRSPGGYLDDGIIKTIENYECTPVLWSWRQDTRDWSRPPVKSVVDTVLNNLQNGDIILFHDYNLKGSPTPDALKVILPELIDRGYRFVTVSELMSLHDETADSVNSDGKVGLE